MSDSPPVRFGAFELDLRTGELRKHGVRLKLQDQPFQVLQALVERPGELVTREELQRRIWGEGTFVDFDQSLNRAVNKVREALGDSAANPRYVETMARRGYRFIAPVEAPPPVAPVEDAPKEIAPPVPSAPAPQTSGRSRRGRVWAIAALAALAIVGIAFWLARNHGPTAPPPRLVRLTAFGGFQTQPSLSPDGNQVAFAWTGEKEDNWDIYVTLVGSATALRLTSDPAVDRQPVWSPDGRQIAFASERGQGGIYLVSPFGGPERKLADLPVDNFSRPSWSFDGKFLVVSQAYQERSGDPNNGVVLLIPTEGGSAPRRILTPQPGRWYELPTFSPDGRRLALSSCTGTQAAPTCRLEILALNPELLPQGDPRVIARTLSNPGFGIAWLEDGDSLVIASADRSPSLEYHLWRIPIGEAGEPQRLELAGANAFWPANDGSRHRLVFSRDLRTLDIWRWQPGGKPAPLSASNVRAYSPQFSHDGRRIAFSSTRSGEEIQIWVVNADGTGWTQITRGVSPFCGTPRWSPDDRWIAFDSQGRNGRWDVWAIEASGGPARKLTDGTADNAVPSWSHDAKWVYFYSNHSGRTEIWRVPAQGGPAEQITHNGGFTAFESTDGKTLYYTKSDRGTEGLFAMSTAGGEERQVFRDRVNVRAFAVFPDGIYYITVQGRNPEIRFHEFASGRSRTVGEIEGRLSGYGLAVSPDRKTFLFTLATLPADLMMIENFR